MVRYGAAEFVGAFINFKFVLIVSSFILSK